ncbi:MAG: UDP-N-acetylmuramate--L-alanine ligase [Myxococcota bacterium]|nr:UDP-N-acetylmuramate--L-alanine ligase [Myxococcota bacterium]
MNRKVRRIHFVGIGGVGMSGLAEVLCASGYTVSGSDMRESEVLERLGGLGIRISIGHDATTVAGADVLVYSSAIPATNPEIQEAERARIPVIARAEMLAELMRLKYGIAISGSHGKTTTSSLVASVLQEGGLDPTAIIGGRLHSLGANSRLGCGYVLVAEADESDGSFLHLVPTVVVITNLDREHLDHYGNLEALEDAFVDFANRVPFYGLCVLCLDDPKLRALLPRIARRNRSYGLSTQAEISATSIEPDGLDTLFVARSGKHELGPLRLRMPGIHNVRNALAAIAVGLEFDVPFPQIREALEQFRGIARRFEIVGEPGSLLVIDDYAHHPTEIRATLAAARSGLGRRSVVVFQPHRYSRTRDLFEELAGCFHDADVVVLTDIYAAGEPKLPGVDSTSLAEAVKQTGHRNTHLVREREEIIPALRELVQQGDAVLFMGAGDIGRLARTFTEEWTD